MNASQLKLELQRIKDDKGMDNQTRTDATYKAIASYLVYIAMNTNMSQVNNTIKVKQYVDKIGAEFVDQLTKLI